jgi:hypothetical protein
MKHFKYLIILLMLMSCSEYRRQKIAQLESSNDSLKSSIDNLSNDLQNCQRHRDNLHHLLYNTRSPQCEENKLKIGCKSLMLQLQRDKIKLEAYMWNYCERFKG